MADNERKKSDSEQPRSSRSGKGRRRKSGQKRSQGGPDSAGDGKRQPGGSGSRKSNPSRKASGGGESTPESGGRGSRGGKKRRRSAGRQEGRGSRKASGAKSHGPKRSGSRGGKPQSEGPPDRAPLDVAEESTDAPAATVAAEPGGAATERPRRRRKASPVHSVEASSEPSSPTPVDAGTETGGDHDSEADSDSFAARRARPGHRPLTDEYPTITSFDTALTILKGLIAALGVSFLVRYLIGAAG